MTIPLTDGDGEESPCGINITDELTRTGVWKSLAGNGKSSRHRKKKIKMESASSTSSEEMEEKKTDDDSNEDEGGIQLNFRNPTKEEA